MDVGRSGAGRAVFLSYASQDAEAVKRIADALRGTGVEVWFDAEGGLEHGDEWDAKIRRQIKECVLFLPIISANTQAREEGYFRIEWELAAQRALGIASGVAFILPVVIDGTREPEALVPDRFRAVQWTKLPGGNVPPEVLQRFLKLWSHRTGALRHEAARATEAVTPVARPSRRLVWPWMAGGLAAIAVAYVAFKPRPSPDEAVRALGEPPQPAAAAPATASPGPAAVHSPTEARQLVAKAFALLRGLEATREDFALAEEYCQRALKLDPDDGEVWAAASQVNAAFVYRGWEATPARKEQTRAMAERAIRLAPTSIEARLAQAGAWSTFGINREEREKLLREVVRDDPTNQGALRFLAVTVLSKPDGLAECLALNERSAALPGGDSLALFNNARYLLDRGKADEAYATLQRSIAQKPFVSALVLRMSIEITRRGDLAAAEETLRQIPQSALQEDRANYIAGLLRYYQRNAAAALEIWQAFPRDYYRDFIFEGPKGLLIGLAYALDNRDAAAKIEWRAALPIVERSMAATPNKAAPYLQQAMLLACLGDKAAAGEALRTHEQLEGRKYSAEQPMTIGVARVYARLGRFDEVLAYPPSGRSVLRVSPDFDALRADPRFAAWMADDPGTATPAAKADDKSVAVLPFANLSGDKEQEYFSDGLTEEILNTLARERDLRVPGRASSFSFKGKNASSAEIAKALNVSRLVEGSVRKAGNKVRISVSLTRASDGFSEELGTFTEELSDVFALQDKVARAVVEKLTQRTVATVAVGMTRNAAAYDAYLKGRALQTRAADNRTEAIVCYEQAVALDPNFALAWARLAEARFRTFQAQFDRSPAVVQGTREAIDRALAAQPDLPEALIMRANLKRGVEEDYAAAQRDLARVESLRPPTADLRYAQAMLARERSQFDEAFRLYREALQLDPQNGDFTNAYAVSLCMPRGEFVEADQLLRRAMAIQAPNSSVPFGNLINLRQAWRGSEAALRLLDRIPPTQAGWRGRRLNLLIALGRLDEARALAGELERSPAPVVSITAFGPRSERPELAQLMALGLTDLVQERAREIVTDASRELARGNRASLIRIAFIRAEIALGHRESARAALEEWRLESRHLKSEYRRAMEFSSAAIPLYALLGDAETVVAIIQELWASGYFGRWVTVNHPDFVAVRNDPRFQELLRQYNAWTKTLPDPTDL